MKEVTYWLVTGARNPLAHKRLDRFCKDHMLVTDLARNMDPRHRSGQVLARCIHPDHDNCWAGWLDHDALILTHLWSTPVQERVEA